MHTFYLLQTKYCLCKCKWFVYLFVPSHCVMYFYCILQIQVVSASLQSNYELERILYKNLTLILISDINGLHCLLNKVDKTQIIKLSPWVPAALVMQGLMNVGWLGSEGWAIYSADIHQSEDTLCPCLTSHCCISPRYIQIPMIPFCAKKN